MKKYDHICEEGCRERSAEHDANVLTDFFTRLAQQQEPLGEPFQTILSDHYWDLWVRTEEELTDAKRNL